MQTPNTAMQFWAASTPARPFVLTSSPQRHTTWGTLQQPLASRLPPAVPIHRLLCKRREKLVPGAAGIRLRHRLHRGRHNTGRPRYTHFRRCPGLDVEWKRVGQRRGPSAGAAESLARSDPARFDQLLQRSITPCGFPPQWAGNLTWGTFTLSVTTSLGRHQTTGVITYYASEGSLTSAISTALQALSNVGSGNVQVTGTSNSGSAVIAFPETRLVLVTFPP